MYFLKNTGYAHERCVKQPQKGDFFFTSSGELPSPCQAHNQTFNLIFSTLKLYRVIELVKVTCLNQITEWGRVCKCVCVGPNRNLHTVAKSTPWQQVPAACYLRPPL